MSRIISSCVILLLPSLALAQGVLEIPRPNSSQNGIGNVSGWKCSAGTLTIRFDDGPAISVLYGAPRADTQSVCGDIDNGFALPLNWNLLGEGRHKVEAFDDGALFATAEFVVTTTGVEFLRKGQAAVTVPDFPRTGETTTLRWQESTQSFVMVGTDADDIRDIAGTYDYSGSLRANTCTFAPPAFQLMETVRVRQTGAALTATTDLQGGFVFNGQIEPDQKFVLFSNSKASSPNEGCTQKLTVILEGDATTDLVDAVFDHDFSGTCPDTDCRFVYLGSWKAD